MQGAAVARAYRNFAGVEHKHGSAEGTALSLVRGVPAVLGSILARRARKRNPVSLRLSGRVTAAMNVNAGDLLSIRKLGQALDEHFRTSLPESVYVSLSYASHHETCAG